MKVWFRISSFLRNLFLKRPVEKQLDDEVCAYADLVRDERIAAGTPAAEVRHTALVEAAMSIKSEDLASVSAPSNRAASDTSTRSKRVERLQRSALVNSPQPSRKPY
jgi:hypothetical protein